MRSRRWVEAYSQRGEVLGVVDEVLHLGREVEHPQAGLQRVDRLVNVLSDATRIEKRLLLQRVSTQGQLGDVLRRERERRAFSATPPPLFCTSSFSSTTRCLSETVPWRTRKSAETEPTKS